MSNNEDIVCISRSVLMELMKAHDHLSGRVIQLSKENEELRRQRDDVTKSLAQALVE